MADAEKSIREKADLNENHARGLSFHLPDERACLQSAAQASIPQYSWSNRQDDGGKVIHVISEKLPAQPSPKRQRTASRGKRNKNEEQKRHSSAPGLFCPEKKLIGLADEVQSKSAPCAWASIADQHDMNQRRDAMYHAECTSYEQSASMKTHDCKKTKKTYRRGQAPSRRPSRTALENQAMNGYWEAVASSAKKQIDKTSAPDSKHHTHPRMQSASLTCGPISYLQQPSNEASKSLPVFPFHEISVLPYQRPYPYLASGHLQLAGLTASLFPLLEGEPAESNQKAQTEQ